MRHSYRLLAISLTLMSVPHPSLAGGRPCEELKSEIAAKLDAKGVKAYSLEIVPADAASDGKEVGRCEGGMKKIIYTRA
ncbi:MAG: hypothetical protein C0434_01690 [Xanthomonadaceae bacterium]|nr:hypothetical protein [Xanthomonadaceae bacterium]